MPRVYLLSASARQIVTFALYLSEYMTMMESTSKRESCSSREVQHSNEWKGLALGGIEGLSWGLLLFLIIIILWISGSMSDSSISIQTRLWAAIYSFSGENNFIMLVLGTTVLASMSYVLCNAFFVLVDITGQPKWIFKYKIQKDKNIPISWMKYSKALKLSSFNAAVTTMLFMLCAYPLLRWRGVSCGYELPSLYTTIWGVVLHVISVEIYFYYGHRLIHHPQVYKYIHKIHHEWTAPVGITAFYSHPVEHFAINLASIVAGTVVSGCHLSTAWLWYFLYIFTSTLSHSGYHLPFLPSPEAHDFHHSKFNQNFGAIGVLDFIHGTDKLFRQHKAYQRHILLLGLTPVDMLPN